MALLVQVKGDSNSCSSEDIFCRDKNQFWANIPLGYVKIGGRREMIANEKIDHWQEMVQNPGMLITRSHPINPHK